MSRVEIFLDEEVTVKRGKFDAVKKINDIKPVTTVTGFMDSDNTLDGSLYIEQAHYVVSEVRGIIVHTVIGDRRTWVDEYDLSDRETAVVFTNTMTDAVCSTSLIQGVKKSKLHKRLLEMYDRLEAIHPGIVDEVLEVPESSYSDEEELSRREEIESVKQSSLERLEAAISSTREALLGLDADTGVSPEFRHMIAEAITNRQTSVIAGIFWDVRNAFDSDSEAADEVEEYLKTIALEQGVTWCRLYDSH